MGELCVANCDLSSILVKLGPNDSGAFGEFPALESGVASGAAGYAGAATLIRKNTNLGGRRNTGRLFWPGLGENQILEGGAIDSAYKAAAQAACDQFLLNLTGAGGPDTDPVPMVILHTGSSAQPPEVLTLAVQSRAATQRRRQRR